MQCNNETVVYYQLKERLFSQNKFDIIWRHHDGVDIGRSPLSLWVQVRLDHKVEKLAFTQRGQMV